METKKQRVRHEDKMARRRLVPKQPKRDTMRYCEIMLSADRAPALRRIVKHGLEDCERRLDTMRRETCVQKRLHPEHYKHPESIPNQMYKEAKRIVRQEMYVLRMMRLQMEEKEKGG